MAGLGDALRSMRERAGIRSQAEWAKRAGVAIGTVNKAETGARMPDCETLGKLLDAIGATLQDLAQEVATAQGVTIAGPAFGTPRQDWVSALTRAGLDADILQAFALGALSFATPRAEADFVESARAVATDLARAAVENARATYQPKPSD